MDKSTMHKSTVHKTLILILISLLAGTFAALAQGNPTGKLTGRVTAGGDPLPGAKVTITSPSLQGSRESFTSPNGEYLFAALPPGDYTVDFSLDGMQPQRADVVVSAAQTRRFDTEMKLSEVTETILVTGNQETFSESMVSATTYDSGTLEKLATGRGLNAAVTLAPGVHDTGPGNDQDTVSVTISGSQSYENLFLVNGVVVNENTRGQALDLFIEDAIQETTVSPSGVSAEYGRFTGGVVNVITKSGGNQFSGSLRASLANEDWEQPTPVTVAQSDELQDTWEATFGGYVLKDRLWFFTAARTFDRSLAEQTFITNIPYANGRSQERLEGKLTAALTSRHSLLASYIDIQDQETNNDPFGIALEPAALSNREDPQTLLAANYTGIFSQKLFIEAQYSERELTVGKGGGSQARDFIGGTTLLDLQNSAATYHTPYFCGFCPEDLRNNESALLKGSYFATTKKVGSHDIVVGVDVFRDLTRDDNHQSPTGFQIWGDTTLLRDGVLYPVITPGVAWVQWFPIFNPSQGATFETTSVFVNDVWQLNDRWSFNLGLRYDKNDGTNSSGAAVADDSNLSPRLGASWDLKGDGDWVINFTWGRYVAALSSSVADSTSAAGTPADFEWDYQGVPINDDPDAPVLITQDQAIQIVFDWFASVGGIDNRDLLIFQNVPGENTLIRGSLDSPNADEITLGFTKRLGSRGLMRADYVHREFGDFYFTRRDLTTGQASSEELGDFDLGLVINDNQFLERRYDGLHTQIGFRINDRLELAGNWSWSHARGNFEGENRDAGPLSAVIGEYPEYKAFPQHNPTGSLAIDARHKVRLWAIYDLIQNDRHSLSVSLLQSFTSGTPYGAEGGASSGDFIDNPGYLTPPRDVVYWFTGRDAFRADDVTSTDLAFNYAFSLSAWGRSIEIFVQPEVVNLFDEEGVLNPNDTVLDATNSDGFESFNPFTETPVQGVHWDFSPNFGQGVREADFQQPRTFSVSLGLRF